MDNHLFSLRQNSLKQLLAVGKLNLKDNIKGPLNAKFFLDVVNDTVLDTARLG